jgi:hypothetical protein
MAMWAALIATAGCGSDQTRGIVAPSPSLPKVAMVLITPGAVALRVGTAAPLFVRVRDSTERRIDGAVVTWSSSNTAVARVDGGTVTGVSLGTATITATSDGVSGTATVTVYQPTVSSILVTPGADTIYTEHHAVLSAITYDQVGAYYSQRLTWTSSDSTVVAVDSTGRVTAGEPGTAVITATAGEIKQPVSITVVRGPISAAIAGDWTMTLSASPSCRDLLPGFARDRQYTVHFVQHGADVSLMISSPTLVVDDPTDNGVLFGNLFSFDLTGDTNYGTWSSTYLHDRLGDGTTLDFDGQITGTVVGSEIHATMSGDMEIGPESATGPSAICRATDHVVTLRR